MGKIYVCVGQGDEEDMEIYDYTWCKDRYKRDVIYAYSEFRNEIGKKVDNPIKDVALAVYDEDELHKTDLEFIKTEPTRTAYLDKELTKEIKFYVFNWHFLEHLRDVKLDLLKSKGLIEEDDGTIFGMVKKEIVVPEKIIPKHKEVIYVVWNEKKDSFETDSVDYN